MIAAVSIEASKTEHGENFPVASFLIAPRLRQPILNFYRFARAADDIADHPHLSEQEKFAGLDALEDTLLGKSNSAKAALPLRQVLAERDLAATHPLDLLTAFRMDVTKRRYANWDELMHYCRYSAMPVGRFVLDVHGEDESTWTYSDPLCSALQVINHLQDCAKDYCELDRVYLPLEILAAHRTNVAALLDPCASPALLAALRAIAGKTAALMPMASKLTLAVRDARLGLETGAIVGLAHKLIAILMVRDPLSERVHLSKPGMIWHGLEGAVTAGASRFIGPAASLRLRLRSAEILAPAAPAPVAKHSSFYLAMRILPSEQREAMYAVYAFCRAVDDIADDGGPSAPRLAMLDQWRADIARLYDGGGPTELTRELARPLARFGMRQQDFLDVIDGMEMDVRREMRVPSWEKFELYCDRVASAVGRLSVKIFGVNDDKGILLSHHLGRALQMTNVLRDLDEDAELGRLYLPAEALASAGIDEKDIGKVLAHARLGDACMVVANRADRHFTEAAAVMVECSKENVRSPRIMASVYRALLDKLVARGWRPPREKVRPSKLQFLGAVARYGIV